MPVPTCCHKSREENPKAPQSIRRATTASAKWLLPSIGLVFIPKCPMCLAGYIALAGVGISFEAADWLRFTLIWTCIASLACFAALTIRRILRRRRFAH